MSYTDIIAALRQIIEAESAAWERSDTDWRAAHPELARDAALKLALLKDMRGAFLTPEWHKKLQGTHPFDLSADEAADLVTQRAALSTLRLIAEAHGLKMEDTNND